MKLSEELSQPRTQKRAEKVWQRIGRLKTRSRGVAQDYEVELDTGESGEGPRYRIARTGVGFPPVAGLSASGQFEMTTSTSISARSVT